MRAYSYDLRQRILRAVDQGKPRAEIIKTFAVSRSTIKRYLKLRRETGDVKPKAIPGRPSKKGTALHAGLLSQLEAHPDAILTEHCQMWKATHDTEVSSATMSHAITRLGWTRPRKRRFERVSRMRPIAPPGGSKPKNWMRANSYSLMSVARTLPSLACMLDRYRESASMALFHGTGEQIFPFWQRSHFKGWVKPLSWKARRILPFLRSTSNSFWLRVYTSDRLSFWTICTHIPEKRCDRPSKHEGADCCFCPPTHQISRQLRRLFPSSKPCYAGWEHARQKLCKRQSAKLF